VRSDARRRWLLAAALAPCVAMARAESKASDGALDLSALMALLARRRSGEARFTEERIVRGFDSPLRSSGLLAFSAPDRFVRRTLEPRPEAMEVDGNTLKLERGGRTRYTTLDALPELAVLVDAMRATLSGDGALLRKYFAVRVGGNAALWTLALVPLDRQLAGQVRSVQLAGQGIELRSVELVLAGGDRSLMLIEPLPAAAVPGAAAASAAPPAGATR